MNKTLLFLITSLFSVSLFAQPLVNEADVLRGSLNENRDWFDILRYDIDVSPNIENKSISGFVVWRAKATKATKQIQIDLQQPLIIDSIRINNATVDKNNILINEWKTIAFTRKNNIALAKPDRTFNINSEFLVWIFYHGVPKEATRTLTFPSVTSICFFISSLFLPLTSPSI